MVELVIMITVISLVSTITLSILFSLSGTSVDVQNEAFGELKFKTMFQKIQNELSQAHPSFIQINSANNAIQFKDYFTNGEADTVANGHITDSSQPLFKQIKQGMKLTFFPFTFASSTFTISSTNRNNKSIWATGITNQLPKQYIILHGEGRLFLDEDKVKLDKSDWVAGSSTTLILGDQVSSIGITKLSGGLLQITISLSLNNNIYSKTEFVVLD